MFDEIPISTVNLPEGRFQTFHDISLSEDLRLDNHFGNSENLHFFQNHMKNELFKNMFVLTAVQNINKTEMILLLLL